MLQHDARKVLKDMGVCSFIYKLYSINCLSEYFFFQLVIHYAADEVHGGICFSNFGPKGSVDPFHVNHCLWRPVKEVIKQACDSGRELLFINQLEQAMGP